MRNSNLIIGLLTALLTQTAPAATNALRYLCETKSAPNSDLKLILKGDEATMDDGETRNKGTLDDSYTGGLSKNYDRYTGFNASEGGIELLVQKSLRKGAVSGKIRVQWRGESFNVDVYQCQELD